MDHTPSTGDLNQQPTPVPSDPVENRQQRISSVPHTAVLVLFLLANSLLSTRLHRPPMNVHGKVLFYLRNIGWEWLAVLYVWLGIRRRITLRSLVGGRWSSAEDVAADLSLGIALWLIILMSIAILAVALGMFQGNPAQSLHEARERFGFLIPNTAVEVAVFVCLSATAGICEEIIFRGYLQRQFSALIGSVAPAIVLQAALFGAAHGYEGGKRMALIAFEGVLLGVVAVWRRSLRPGMVAHATQDAISGIVARHLR
jgi:membrane protease YdiL (CAAX protease family)